MKHLIPFIKKEFLHVIRDRWTMMIILVLPVVMMLLFGYAVTNEIKNTNIGVLNLSKDSLSNRIIQRLEQSEYFTLSHNYKSYKDIEPSFRKSQVGLVVVFDENFQTNLSHLNKAQIQIIADATDPNTAKTLVSYVSTIAAQELKEQSQITYKSSQTQIQNPEIQSELKLLYNPQMKSSYNFVPAVMGFIVVLICTMMTSITIVREKEKGTIEMLLASPTKPITIVISKLTPFFTVSVINIITIFLVSYFIMGVPIRGNLIAISLLSLVYLLVALSLGLLFSTIAHSQIEALLYSGLIFLMPTTLLSGMLFPIESMPSFLQAIAQAMPAKWFISAIRKLMIMGVEARYVMKEFLVLTLMAIGFIALSLKLFKKRL